MRKSYEFQKAMTAFVAASGRSPQLYFEKAFQAPSPYGQSEIVRFYVNEATKLTELYKYVKPQVARDALLYGVKYMKPLTELCPTKYLCEGEFALLAISYYQMFDLDSGHEYLQNAEKYFRLASEAGPYRTYHLEYLLRVRPTQETADKLQALQKASEESHQRFLSYF